MEEGRGKESIKQMEHGEEVMKAMKTKARLSEL